MQNPAPATRGAGLSVPWLKFVLLTCATVLADGYHFAVDDGAIYLPAANKAFDSRLYPFGAEFFLSHARLSLFGPVVGRSARLLHATVPLAALVWQGLCIFLLLIAGWQLAAVFFRSIRSQWGAVMLLAALLPIPVAGTALVLSDNYLSARSFSTPFGLLAIGFFLRGRWAWGLLWLAMTALIHPQMAVYCAAFLLILLWSDHRSSSPSPSEDRRRIAEVASSFAGWLALAPPWLLHTFSLKSPTSPYLEVLASRTYFFAYGWHWYEWLGVVLPLCLLALFAIRPPREASVAVPRVARTLARLGSGATLLFLLLSADSRLGSFTRLQPMRAFHVIYLLLILLVGGLLAEHVLRRSPLRWALLFLSIAGGMFAVDRVQYPHSSHIEWPWATPTNPWLQAFAWVRTNTPVDAVFALDPEYIRIPEDDTHGFRAISDRSALADAYKDSGAVTMFPDLLADWEAQQQVQRGWRSFQAADFERLSRVTPVSWVIVARAQEKGLNCPYRNVELAVCRLRP